MPDDLDAAIRAAYERKAAKGFAVPEPSRPRLVPAPDSPSPPRPEPPEVTSHQPPVVTSTVTSNSAGAVPEAASLLVTTQEVTSHQGPKVDDRRGSRHSKKKGQFNNRIDLELLQQIQVFCAERGMTQQEFAELAAAHYMQAVTSHHGGESASLLAHDDRRGKIVWNTEVTIINLYLRYNPKNKWTPRDDRLAAPYNGVDIRLIEMAIIDTQINAGFKRIHTFDYYRGQLDVWVENTPPAEALDMLVTVARRRWALAKEGK